jgi:4-carboxymuconolactone decarboxylase
VKPRANLRLNILSFAAHKPGPEYTAMTRFPPLPKTQWSPAQQRVAAAIVSGPRGELRGPFVPLIYSPDLADCVQKVGEYLRFSNRLPEALVELGVLVTARRYRCPNIWHSHRALALKAGLDPAIISDLAIERRPDSMSESETAVFDFCSELVRDVGVTDQSFDRVVALWDRATAIDLIGLCGYYIMLAMVLNTAQVPLPDGAAPFQQ